MTHSPVPRNRRYQPQHTSAEPFAATLHKPGIAIFRAMVALLILFASVSAPAKQKQPFWETKDWTQWSKYECRKILTISPWASTTYSYTITKRQSWPTQEYCPSEYPYFPCTRDYNEVSWRNWNPITIQLRSALPVRLALLRLLQIESRFGRYPAKDRHSFELEVRNSLSHNFEDFIVVNVSSHSNIYFSGAPTEVLLQPPNRARLPFAKTMEHDNFQHSYGIDFLFPRFVNGQPVVSDSDQALAISYRPLKLQAISFGKTKESSSTEFPLKQMIYRGKLEY
jgi:hypothetical protein